MTQRKYVRPWGYGYYIQNKYIYYIDVFLSKVLVWLHPHVLLPISNWWWNVYEKPRRIKQAKSMIDLHKNADWDNSNSTKEEWKSSLAFYELRLKGLTDDNSRYD